MTPGDLPGDEFQLSPRLVDVGEPVTLNLRGAERDDRLEVFPRYLETCDPDRARQSAAPLAWLDDLEPEVLSPAETVQYTPRVTGNFLARWTSRRHGVEYRYFAAIDPSYVVYRPAVWTWPTPFPATGGLEIHNGGLPLDWRVSSTNPDEPHVPRLLDEQRRFGGGIVFDAAPPGTEPVAEAAHAIRAAVARLRNRGLDVGRVVNLWYGGGLSNDRVQAACAAGFDVIDGYVPRASTCGMGAPYFPFYISPTDYRFPSQDGPSAATSCVFDFTGSWHFHGPIGFHRPSSRGSWERARHFIDLAAQEAALTAQNSGTHNFLTTLIDFESPVAWGKAAYEAVWDEERGRQFFDEYMHLLAFDHTRRWPIVFARAADYADYFRAHHTEMPRRIVSSITHDIAYDRYWTDEWHEQGISPTGYVPASQSLRAFREARVMPHYNVPMSFEFINYNDNHRTCRFEYACPKPVHYYDLTGDEPWPTQPCEEDLPDPEVTPSNTSSRDRHEVTYTLAGGARFPDYLLAVWDIPRELRGCPLETNAKEFIWVENTDGNCRGILRFDLEAECNVWVRWSR